MRSYISIRKSHTSTRVEFSDHAVWFGVLPPEIRCLERDALANESNDAPDLLVAGSAKDYMGFDVHNTVER